MSTVSMSQQTADGLSTIGFGDFQTVETAERMAWIVRIMRYLSDKPEWFPKGKWATIQHIELQVIDAACIEAGLLATQWKRDHG